MAYSAPLYRHDFVIDVYAFFFKVLPASARARQVVVEYLGTLVEHKLTKVRGKWSMQPDCTYAAKDFLRGRYHLHINVYDDFMAFLEERRIMPADVLVNHHPASVGKDVELAVVPAFQPRDNQVPIIQHCTTIGKQSSIGSQPGSGKSLSLDARIRIPGGWSTMGAMTVGTQVIAPDGSTTVVTGVFPQGVTRVYRVTFADGRHVDCSPDHLWQVRLRSNESEQILDTEEIKRRLYAGNDRARRITVPLVEAEEGIEQEHAVHPYLLGVILGDGSIKPYSVQISKPDTELRDILQPYLPVGTSISELASTEGMTFSIIGEGKGSPNPLNRMMVTLELADKRAHEKFIPPAYLEGSRSQRLALLQGLMDTDGTVSTGTASFSSSSRSLAEGVQYLVRSLGGIALLSTRTPTYSYKGEKLEGLTDYRVSIRYPRPDELFRLTRKRVLYQPNQYTDGLRLRIDSIVEIEPAETQCIAVEHASHLFVTNDFIVTHNTLMFMFVAAIFGKRFVMRSLGGFAGRWEEAFVKYLGLTKDEYRICCGAKALFKLIRDMRAGKCEDVKAIYISNGAIRDFIASANTPKYEAAIGSMLAPEDLYAELGVGLVGIDEAHKEIHANFIADLYTNAQYRIALTATLLARDAFQAKVYEMYLPQRYRRDMGALNIYVDAYEVTYNLAKPKDFQQVIKQTVYSHNQFERTIMKHPKTLANYQAATFDYIMRDWLATRTYETKAIFYCGLVDMCSAMTDYFKARMPDIRVAQFNAGDDYDVLLDNDFLISTALKAGTAVDIADLSRVYNGISVDSPNQMVQLMGRLRELTHMPTEQCAFHQFSCLDIPKQVTYRANRKTLLTPRVNFIKEIPLGKLV